MRFRARHSFLCRPTSWGILSTPCQATPAITTLSELPSSDQTATLSLASDDITGGQENARFSVGNGSDKKLAQERLPKFGGGSWQAAVPVSASPCRSHLAGGSYH